MVTVWHKVDEQLSSLTSLRLKLMDYFQDKLPATTNFKMVILQATQQHKMLACGATGFTGNVQILHHWCQNHSLV